MDLAKDPSSDISPTDDEPDSLCYLTSGQASEIDFRLLAGSGGTLKNLVELDVRTKETAIPQKEMLLLAAACEIESMTASCCIVAREFRSRDLMPLALDVANPLVGVVCRSLDMPCIRSEVF